jgi:TPR repeat protein
MRLLKTEHDVSIYQTETDGFLIKDSASGILELDRCYEWSYIHFLLGCCYKNEKLGFKKDNERSFYWFLKAASAGEAHAQAYLGYFYQYGLENVIEQNLSEAEYWYRLAAQQKDMIGLNNLGGLLVTKGQYREAKNILKQTLETGIKSPRPYFHLGRLYEAVGRTEKAIEMYNRATELGDKQAAEKVEHLRIIARGKVTTN